MQSYEFTNLRSFGEESGRVELNSLTLLLGSNSSGKSSLIRFLPLLKQSFETRTTGPILWFGRLVDFGDFKSSMHRGGNLDNITYSFGFGPDDIFMLSPMHRRLISFTNPDFRAHCKVTLVANSKNDAARIGGYVFGIYDHHIELIFNSKREIDSITINGIECELDNSVRPVLDDVLPRLTSRLYFEDQSDNTDSQFYKIITETLKLKDIKDKVNQIYKQIRIDSMKNMLESLKENALEISPTWYRVIADWTISTPIFKQLIVSYMYENLSSIAGVMYSIAKRQIENVTYIAPLRANAERYYRFQDLAIDEIDSKGQNTPMYLYNMSNVEKKQFRDWCISNFGFYFVTSLSNGQITVNVGIEDKKPEIYNIIDMGFGFSQILPIIAQIWQKVEKTNRQGRVYPSIIIIEQPELHLHPKMQAKFAEMIVRLSCNNEKIRFLIETHSQTIMNKIGNMIYEKSEIAKEISVYLLKKENGHTISRKTFYDDEGVLVEWPVNFLESY
ncbi:AAA family ATPase [Deinococcus aquaticus]|uniref:AAA family ATPase n=1 Tax=Deinococcus aquaticus TaxID=328692 RepID=UPI003F47B8A5